MAHKKGVGSTDNGRDSKSKRLGVKLFGGQAAKAGNIIIRQRGTKYHPGENVYMGKDFTIHAKVDGKVSFSKSRLNRMFVSIEPADVVDNNDQHSDGSNPANLAAKSSSASKPQRDTEVATAEPTTSTDTEIQAAVSGEVNQEPVHIDDAPEMPAPSEKIVLPSGKKITLDDLKVIEGIGPKIEGLLNAAGITSWRGLADADQAFVQNILDEAGPRYNIHDPGTWAKQASLAADGNWGELEQLQDELDGGKATNSNKEEE